MGGSTADIQTELKGLAFAAEWPEHVIAQVAALSTHFSARYGALLFREGEPDDNVYFVLSGRIALEMTVPARGTIRLLTLSGGDLLGWSPLVGGREMTASAVVLEDSLLLKISGAKLLALCQQDPELGFAVMRRVAWALSQRLMATRLQLLDLYSHSAPAILKRPE